MHSEAITRKKTFDEEYICKVTTERNLNTIDSDFLPNIAFIMRDTL